MKILSKFVSDKVKKVVPEDDLERLLWKIFLYRLKGLNDTSYWLRRGMDCKMSREDEIYLFYILDLYQNSPERMKKVKLDDFHLTLNQRLFIWISTKGFSDGRVKAVGEDGKVILDDVQATRAFAIRMQELKEAYENGYKKSTQDLSSMVIDERIIEL